MASRGTWWLCFAMSFACYSWRLLPPRQLGATRIIKRRKVLVSGSDHGDCEGFLTFLWWRAKRYSSGLLVTCVILILCWLCGTYWGLGVWCQLACEPPSECITTTRTNLPESKWTSVKNLMSSCSRISLVILWLIVIIYWLVYSSTRRYNSLSLLCTYILSVAKLFSVISFDSKLMSSLVVSEAL
jgi:hypothetical protein